MQPFTFAAGTAPLLISMPHAGIHIPDALSADLTPAAREVPDTDWHLERLYEFARGLGASMLTGTHSRVVIDLNRDPSGAPLYPGASNTELCPTALFDDTPIHRPGCAPDTATIAERTAKLWRPYHEQIERELARIRAAHGIAILFDAHSIRSEVPRFFAGRLPDLNLGTNDGRSAHPRLAQQLLRICEAHDQYSAVLDGRFKGGYITRHYGRPEQGVHAVQLEMAQSTYMQERPPFAFDEQKAAELRPVLRELVIAMLAFARTAASGQA